MDLKCRLNHLDAYRSHAQVVGVPKTNLTPQILQLIHGDPLHGPLGPNRHKHGCDDG